MPEQKQPKVLDTEIRIGYKWTTGDIVGRFLTEMRDNKKLFAGLCPQCGRIWMPPQECCPVCLVDFEQKDLIAVSDRGTVTSFTVVKRQFMGQPAEPPYAIVAVRLDGADTDFIHLIRDPASIEKLENGAHVRAAWKDERIGSLLDLDGFAVKGRKAEVAREPRKRAVAPKRKMLAKPAKARAKAKARKPARRR